MKCGHKFEDVCDGNLELVLENYPWTIDHYQCNKCDSTYNIYEIEERIIKEREEKIDKVINAPVLATASNGETHSG